MPKATTTCNNILPLIFNATTWANIAENDSTSPNTDLYLSLHIASPGIGGSQLTNETAYTNYVRLAVVRTTTGGTAPAAGASANAAPAPINITMPKLGKRRGKITTDKNGNPIVEIEDVEGND